MKKKKVKPIFEKFRVAELKRPEYIFGGNGGGDDGTNDEKTEKRICISKSTRYIVVNGPIGN